MNMTNRRRALMASKKSEILYEISDRAVNDEVIETGVTLFRTDIDWTIACDINMTAGTSLPVHYIHSPNVYVKRGGSGGGYITIFEWRSGGAYKEFRTTGNTNRNPIRIRFVLTHQKGSNSYNATYRSQNNAIKTGSPAQIAFSSSDEVLTLGYGNGTSRLPTGTINHAIILNRIMSLSEINDFMGVEE